MSHTKTVYEISIHFGRSEEKGSWTDPYNYEEYENYEDAVLEFEGVEGEENEYFSIDKNTYELIDGEWEYLEGETLKYTF